MNKNDLKTFIHKAFNFGNYSAIEHEDIEEIDNDHGRLEVRRYWITGEVDSSSTVSEWKGLKSIGMVEHECWTEDKRTIEKRFFINSIVANAKKFSQAVREHWGVVNTLHWRLDVVFGDDANKIRKEKVPQ